MRFFILKEFRGGKVEEYLRNTFTSVLRNLQTGLSQLDFLENFRTFQVEDLVLVAGTEAEIPNRLGDGETPRFRSIVRQSGGTTITDGDTAWDTDFVYLKNIGPGDAVVTVIFFR
jgi:hypothetical protein